ncbi:MAG: hypothetical protein Q9201_004587 [Fulgogasparrea decipioides]
MDIHRCRFVPYPPSAINALSFSHPSSLTTSSKGPPTLKLAIGRANGDIEIWNPLRGAWHQESIFRGGKDRSIECLVWTQDPEEQDKNGFILPGRLRLFSIGYSDSVTEWDLGTGRPARHASGNYGELWCVAGQPRMPSPDKSAVNGVNGRVQDGIQYQSLAVGCADGSIVLMSTADGDLKFQRTLTRPPKKKARVLSIAWQNSYTVVTGHADSIVRVFDARNGQQTRSMSLGGGLQGGPKETLVWAVRCMVDGTIVSGDSTGTVSFWDAGNYTRLQRITSHKADILDLTVSVDGETVFSGGMDRRTTLYRRTAGSKPGEKKRWVEVAHQRFHSHDIKTMAAFETKNISILASGGLDTSPIIVPIREFGKEHHRTLSSLPQQPPMRSAPKKGLLVSWWDREVSIWKVSKWTKMAAGVDELEGSLHPPSHKLMAKVLLQGEESIDSVDIVADGSLLAVSTLAETKAFHLRNKADSTIAPRKVDLPSEIAKTGVKIVRFSPDGKWLLIITSNNRIQLIRVVNRDDSKKAPLFLKPPINLKRLPRKETKSKYLHGSLGAYDRSICRVAFSADSRILVAGDFSGHLDTYVLEGHEDLTQDPPITTTNHGNNTSSSSSTSSDDSEPKAHPTLIYAQHWRRSPTAHLVPRLPSGPLILSFRPAISPLPSTPLTNGLHPTRHNPHPHSHDLPKGEDRLFVLTAEHQIYEFNILSGHVSDWTRRNPTSALPREFRKIRDRAMGCIWDISPTVDKERIWLYGSGWLWMFDLGQDLPIQPAPFDIETDEDLAPSAENAKKKKRKRKRGQEKQPLESNGKGGDGEERRRERDSGAGSRIATHELHTGTGRKMRKIVGAEGKEPKMIELDHRRDYSPDYSNDEQETAIEHGFTMALIGLRRGGDLVTQMPEERPAFWGTYKYRPILGIVPIEGEGEDTGVERDGETSKMVVEVALVERPMFDIDLPGRYYGDQEWSEKKDAEGGV